MAPITGFAAKVTHVTISGTMLGGNEIWQTGFYMGKLNGDSEVPAQATADFIRDKWLAIWTNGANGFNQAFTFNQVKMARLGLDGRYDGSAVVTSFPGAAAQGGAGGGPLPPQVSLVATTIAGSGKGLAGKGRMYLPGISFAIDNTGHLGNIETQKVADYLTQFFQDIYADPSTPDVAINASKGSAKFLGVGARNVPINGIRVGNVYDTQRRRRDALTETYKVGGLIGP